jgi:hypothetical protein
MAMFNPQAIGAPQMGGQQQNMQQNQPAQTGSAQPPPISAPAPARGPIGGNLFDQPQSPQVGFQMPQMGHNVPPAQQTGMFPGINTNQAGGNNQQQTGRQRDQQMFDDLLASHDDSWAGIEQSMQGSQAALQRRNAAIQAAMGRSIGGGFAAGSAQAALQGASMLMNARNTHEAQRRQLMSDWLNKNIQDTRTDEGRAREDQLRAEDMEFAAGQQEADIAASTPAHTGAFGETAPDRADYDSYQDYQQAIARWSMGQLYDVTGGSGVHQAAMGSPQDRMSPEEFWRLLNGG